MEGKLDIFCRNKKSVDAVSQPKKPCFVILKDEGTTLCKPKHGLYIVL